MPTNTDANTDANIDTTDAALEGLVNSYCYNFLERQLKWEKNEYVVISKVWTNPKHTHARITITIPETKQTFVVLAARVDYDVDYE
jgi:hypothetical protein